MGVSIPDDLKALLDELYSGPKQAVWLDIPQQILGGNSPRSMIEAGRAEEVRDSLQRMLDGAYI